MKQKFFIVYSTCILILVGLALVGFISYRNNTVIVQALKEKEAVKKENVKLKRVVRKFLSISDCGCDSLHIAKDN